jgi:4-hydroxybenzoate polyprenyltransferase
MKPRTAPWMITWWTLALVCLCFTTVVSGIGRLVLFIAAAILASTGSRPTQRKGFG